MKEQVSVDDDFEKFKRETIVIKKTEYHQLKRLDENVRRKIAFYEECIKTEVIFAAHYREKAELLKSLYDEIEQEC